MTRRGDRTLASGSALRMTTPSWMTRATCRSASLGRELEVPGLTRAAEHDAIEIVVEISLFQTDFHA